MEAAENRRVARQRYHTNASMIPVGNFDLVPHLMLAKAELSMVEAFFKTC